ncbi:MAG: hypothetical protein KF749_12110 [Bacteroidetes bacterium]|nr:hypothetical protein [Bacteroidota bacterium]
MRVQIIRRGGQSGNILRAILAAGFFVVFSTLPAQTFHRISVERGLPHSDVNAILQDSRGFIWFGTSGGLARFDGYEFTIFKHNPADTNSLSDDAVLALCEDGDGNLWIGTFSGGLNRLSLSTEKIQRFIHHPSDSNSIASNQIKAICRDASGNLWIGTWFDGLSRLDLLTGRFSHFRHDPSDPNSPADNNIRSLVEDKSGRLWIGTANGGLSMLDPTRTRFTRFTHNPSDLSSLSNNGVKALFVDADGFVWAGTDNGLNRFDEARGTFTRFSPQRSSAQSAFPVYAMGEAYTVMKRTFWIGTQGMGVFRFDPLKGTFARSVADAAQTSSLSSDVIRCMFTDNAGGLWIGTEGGGVSKLNTERQQAIRHLRHDAVQDGGISKGAVWSVAGDASGTLWVGTFGGGLDAVNMRTGAVKRFRNEPRNPHSLPEDNVSALRIDRNGNLWVGTASSGLAMLDQRTNRFAIFLSIELSGETISSNAIDEILETSDGMLWIATSTDGVHSGGLNMLNPATGRFRQFKNNPADSASLSSDRVSTLLEDSKGILWIGTEGGGLNALNRSTMKFARYFNHPSDQNSISNDRVYAIEEDVSGRIWVGTANGLNSLDPATGRFTRYFRSDGLPSDYIRSILRDSRKNFWLVTTRGICKFNPQRKSFITFDSNDGFLSDDFTDAHFTGADGTFYLGSQHGLSYFHPDSLIENGNPPPVVVSAFNIFENPYAAFSAGERNPSFTLGYNENFLSFVISSLDYTNPSRNLYAYKMEELDHEWVKSGTRRYASYPALQPGTYVFRVIGSNNHGVWNTEGSSITITINPPWWQTWWFRLLAAGVLIGIGAAIYNYRVAKLLEMERMRVRIASDLHDDIGSSLSSIAMITDVVRRRLPEETKDSGHLATATSAARSAADALRNIVWVNPEHDVRCNDSEDEDTASRSSRAEYTFRNA